MFETFSAEETQAFGQKLGALLKPRDVLSLKGDLGAGKTTIAQGIGLGLGVEEPMNSPTYLLVQEYSGRIPLLHADLYRLRNADDLAGWGFDEYFEREGAFLIEWADRAGDELPDDLLTVELTADESIENRREIKLTASGIRSQELVDEMQAVILASRNE